MDTNTTSSTARSLNTARRALLLGAALFATSFLAIACNGNPPAGSPEYKAGALGNGSFLFSCDDSVACDSYSGDAKLFPKIVASGATFNVSFVPNASQSTITISSTDQTPNGTVLFGIAPYISGATDGFATIKPGYGMIAAKNAQGAVIDYITMQIVKPTELVVYDALYKGQDPDRLSTATLQASDHQQYRVVSAYGSGGTLLAGVINVDWDSSDKSVLAVDNYTGGVVTIVAQKSGKSTLTATAGGLTKTIDITVQGDVATSADGGAQ